MGLRNLPGVGLGLAALVLSAASAASAAPPAASRSGVTAVHLTSSVASSLPLHGFKKTKGCGFTNGTSPSGNGVIAQDLYDLGIVADGADDFVCARSAKLKSVRWLGYYYGGGGPAESFNVYVYADNRGEPSDTAMCSYPEQKLRDLGGVSFPNFTIKKLKGSACKLRADTTYWLEVQAHMAFQLGGQFGWAVTPDQTGHAADWRNPDGGFGTSCAVFQNGTDMQTCVGISGTPDFMFSVK